MFACDGRFFKKHSTARSAVHRDMILAGRWPASLGADYDLLIGLREVADYGVLKHAEREEAADAIRCAERIIHAVHKTNPVLFKLSDAD